MRRSTIVLGLAFTAASCTPLAEAEAPKRPLPAYAGHAMDLFDDAIEPVAVGLNIEAKVDPRSDKKLRERAQTADATLRVRVTTLTVKDTDEGGTRYVVAFKTVDKLGGAFPPGDAFEIVVAKTTPAAAIMKGMGERITGKTFVAFLRKFVRPDGDDETHFHLAPDSPMEVSAINDAYLMKGL
jgi:hypothetical protein